MKNDCVFCAIIDGEIPSEKVFENEDFVLIKDINQKAKIHLVALPKFHYAHIDMISIKQAETIGRILSTISKLTDKLGLNNGYRVIINQGKDANQTVQHIHIHILGGETLAD